MPEKHMIDLDKIVKRWAVKAYEADPHGKMKKVKVKDLDMSVNWTKVKFCSLDPDWIDKQRATLPAANVLYKTRYENNTSATQEYTFKAERASKSVSTVEVETGVCTEMEMSFSLKTPLEVFEANAGFSRETSVTDTDSHSTEEEVMWGVETLIKVPRGSITTAELEVEEDTFSGKYRVTTYAYGQLNVVFTNPHDDNDYITTMAGDLVTIVDIGALPEERKRLRLIKDSKKYGKPVVEYDTEGTCNFRYGTRQEIKINEEPLGPRPVDTVPTKRH